MLCKELTIFVLHVFLSFHCIKCLQLANESEQGEEKLKADVLSEKIEIELNKHEK